MKKIVFVLLIISSCSVVRAELSMQFGNSLDAYNIPTYDSMGEMPGYNGMVNRMIGETETKKPDYEPSYMRDNEKIRWYEKPGRNTEEGKGPILKLFGIPAGGYQDF